MHSGTMRFLIVFFGGFFSISSSLWAAPEIALPNVTTYSQLLYAIRKTRVASEQRLDKAIDQEKVREAWETGRLIDTHVLQHKERAEYGQQVVVRLAKDLETSETELRYMLQFARTYPIHRPADELNWSQYQALLSLNDPKEREEVTKKAVQQKWNRDQVRAEVQKRKAPDAPVKPVEKLEAKPGKVGTYRIVKAVAGPYKGEAVIDLGFSNYFRLGKMAFKEGDIVQASMTSTKPGVAASFEFTKLRNSSGNDGPARDEYLFTYHAYVTQVIDGDTVDAVIDLGFGFTTRQKLRLRGLDAPEIESAQGREAKAFLENELAKSGGIVLIKTLKSDKYDRYLADVWLPSRSANDNYLNNLLLEKSFAVRMQD